MPIISVVYSTFSPFCDSKRKLIISETFKVEMLEAIPTSGLTMTDVPGNEDHLLLPKAPQENGRHLPLGHEDHLLPRVQDTPGKWSYCMASLTGLDWGSEWLVGRTWQENRQRDPFPIPQPAPAARRHCILLPQLPWFSLRPFLSQASDPGPRCPPRGGLAGPFSSAEGKAPSSLMPP